MPTAYVIHKGFAASEEIREAATQYGDGFDVTVKTARLGPEATVGNGSGPDRVITNDKAVADFWEGRGADVKRVTGLPKWLPKRSQLEADDNISGLSDVVSLARGAVLESVKGIGPASADKIEAALIEHIDYDG